MAKKTPKAETHAFQAQVGRLLDIVANSFYSHKEIFLRELISNASDACDRLRYAALTAPELLYANADLKITLSIDKNAKELTVTDNGIGMTHDELASDLGTIARSGTSEFMSHLSGDAAKDMSLIGQFGMGFYSAFMVADQVTVTSRKAGDDACWTWRSDGKGEFTLSPADSGERGTAITLHLRKGDTEFLEPARLRTIVKTYSDHIALPIVLKDGDKEDTLNTASALWTRPKSEINSEQYTEFYRHVGHLGDEPWLVIHNHVEGKLEYRNLLFVPQSKPFDLFDAERKSRIKLYVRRVFITDDCQDLMPGYLRFLRGVVDSEDLPLNVSREMLQNNPLVAKLRSGLVKRVIGELRKKAEKDAEAYASFWRNFGSVLKEGIYEDFERRDELIGLARFSTTTSGDSLVSLADYIGRMVEGQDSIFYISGEDTQSLRKSPQLEAFDARGIEVLLLADPVDEFWLPAVGEIEGKKFASVTQGGLDLGKIAKPEEKGEEEKSEASETPAGVNDLVALFKLTLKDAVKDVRTTERLTDSPVCLVADEGDVDMHLSRLLKQHRRIEETATRILEINPTHPLITSLATRVGNEGASEELGDAAYLLLDQARIVEGESIPDPSAFARRLAGVMQKGLAV
jgi:molecular chaperone HtpG